MRSSLNFKESAELKLDLLIEGIKIDESIKNASGFKEYSPKVYYHHLKNIDVNKIPNEIILPYELATDLRINDTSPYTLKFDGKPYIEKDGEFVTEVEFPPRPSYYDKLTSTGKKMSEVSTILGLDLFAFVLYYNCYFWNIGKECHFCNFGYTSKQFKPKPASPEEISEAFREAINDKNVKIRHISCTTGTQKNTEIEAKKLIKTLRLIKKYLPEDWKKIYGTFVVSPLKDEHIEKLAEIGVENIGVTREVGNDNIFKEICPGKYELRNRAFRTIKKGVEELGWGHVSVAFVSSLEPLEDTIRMCEKIAEMGGVPYVAVFRPAKGSKLENKKAYDKEYHIELFRRLVDIYEDYDLVQSESKRPVLCERCSKSSVYNEAWLGAFD